MSSQLLKPRAVRPGDAVGIVAAASPVRDELLARGESVLREMGLVVRRAANVLARSRYTAGSAAERAGDLNAMLRDPEIRLVWVARGGYGSPPLLPLLDADALRADPKLIIGSSDATALLLWALNNGVTALHGPMPAREFHDGRIDREEILAYLSSPLPAGALRGPEFRVLHPGLGTGRLTGGCLSLVVASLGTPWEIDTEGALLFLEDIDTRPYQIDRMLTQLAQANKLSGVAGLAFGEMPGCVQTATQGYTLDEVLSDLTAHLAVPVVAGLPCGHTTGVHRPLPFGVRATLNTNERTLSFDEGVVA